MQPCPIVLDAKKHKLLSRIPIVSLIIAKFSNLWRENLGKLLSPEFKTLQKIFSGKLKPNLVNQK